MNHSLTLALLLVLSFPISPATAAAQGYQAEVQVSAPTRLDWIYALANQSPAEVPQSWLEDYDSTQQTYELFVPKNYIPKKSYPVVVFISPGAGASGFRHWEKVCQELGIIFAGPHQAGNNRDTRERVRIVMDVLDDVRRKYKTDADRTYIAGFSGGARIACAIGFSLPEYFGGVIPICAGGELREESYLRQRVIDRLSVAHVTGESDFNRGEVERFRHTALDEVGVRSKVWVVPKFGHGVPGGKTLIEVYRWLDAAADERAKLAKKYPASRIPASTSPDRAAWAAALLKEANGRLEEKPTVYSGLMQLKAVMSRWPDLPQAAQARKTLTEYQEGADQSWQDQDVAEQRRFLIARARSVDAYGSGPLPKQYQAQQADMLQAAIALWKLVLQDGQDAAATEEAKKRVPALENLLKDVQE